MTEFLAAVLGPRVTDTQRAERTWRYMLPTVLLLLARVSLLVSIFFPWWSMVLHAPQFPNGLYIEAYVNRLAGSVREVDGLNHYIGMQPLEAAASFERSASVWAIIALFLLSEGAAKVHSRWAAVLVAPVVLLPLGFLIDLQYWLWHHGQHLDPKAPLSSSVAPFTPPVLGIGEIGQFHTESVVEFGFWLAVAAAVFTVVGLWFHRRAYKPLYEAARARREGNGK